MMSDADDELGTLPHDNDALPPSSAITFLHAVGASTLRQGLAVPIIAQIDWLANMQKGQAAPVTIQFGSGQAAPAIVRRINNAQGHLQFRYEAKQHAPLRDYLTAVFASESEQPTGVLKVSEIQPRVFLFEPVAVGPQPESALCLTAPHFHNCSKRQVGKLSEYRELQKCIADVRYKAEHSQSEYNSETGVRASPHAAFLH